jgi:hypothetical protein
MLTASRVRAVVNIAAGKAAEVIDTRQVAARIAFVSGRACWLINSAELSASGQLARKLPFRPTGPKSRTHDVVKRTRAAAVGDRLGADEISLISLRKQARARLGVKRRSLYWVIRPGGSSSVSGMKGL